MVESDKRFKLDLPKHLNLKDLLDHLGLKFFGKKLPPRPIEALESPVKLTFYDKFANLSDPAQSLLKEIEFKIDGYYPQPWQKFLENSWVNSKTSPELMEEALQELIKAGLVMASTKKSLFPEEGAIYVLAPEVSESMHKLGLIEIPDS